MGAYFLNVLIALDQLANALLLGTPDETLSARAHRRGDWRERVIDTLFFWQPRHCERAYVAELLRRHLPRVYEVKP